MIEASGASVDLSGGIGGQTTHEFYSYGETFAAGGRFIYQTNVSAPFNGGLLGTTIASTVGGGSLASNPHVGQETPYLPGLVGGAKSFGIAGFSASDALQASFLAEARRSDAVVALLRLDHGLFTLDHDFSGYDMIAVVNLTDGPIQNPTLKIGANDTQVLGGLSEVNNVPFLAAGAVWVTLVPSNANFINFALSGVSDERVFNATDLTMSMGINDGKLVLSNALGTVDQTLAPHGEAFANQVWQTLGTRQLQGNATFFVSLSEEGTVAADALRLVRLDAQGQPLDTLPQLDTLAVEKNPLDNVTHQFVIGETSDRVFHRANTPGLSYSPNDSAPQMTAPQPVRVPTGTNNVFVTLTATDPDNPAVVVLNLDQSSFTVVNVATNAQTQFAPTNLAQLGVSAQGSDGSWYVASYDMLVRFDSLADTTAEFYSQFFYPILDLEFGPNGDLYVLTSDMRISRLDSQGVVQSVSDPSNFGGYEPHLAVSPHNVVYLVTTNSYSFTSNVERFDATTLQMQSPLNFQPPVMSDLAFGPDGTIYGGGFDDTYRWSLSRYSPFQQTQPVIVGEPVTAPLSNGLISAVAFGPDGRLYVSVYDFGEFPSESRIDVYDPASLAGPNAVPVTSLATTENIPSSRSLVFNSPVHFTASVTMEPAAANAPQPFGSATVFNGHLTLTSPDPLFQGTARVTVTAFDGPANQPGSGRTTQRSFDVHFGTTGIYGTRFDDVNGDGFRDVGEPGIEGSVVYVDLNNDGVLDANEKSTITNASGEFRIVGLDPGAEPTWHIREANPTDWPWTSALLDVASQADPLSGLLLGNIRVANLGTSRRLDEGTSVAFSGTIRDPQITTGLTTRLGHQWTVTLGGQTVASSTPSEADGGGSTSFTFTPPDNGIYIVALTVTDLDHGDQEYVDEGRLVVDNVAPHSLTIGGVAANPKEGESLPLSANFVDPGTSDRFTYAWRVTRGGVEQAAQSASNVAVVPDFPFTPNDQGTYVVTLVVADDDGGSATTSRTIQVAANAPTASFSGLPVSPVEGTEVALIGTIAEPGTVDTFNNLTWTVLRGGTIFTSGTGSNIRFTPDQDGDYVVRFSGFDSDSLRSNIAETTIAVANVLPVLGTLPATATIDEGGR